jgi:hypothetical protein
MGSYRNSIETSTASAPWINQIQNAIKSERRLTASRSLLQGIPHEDPPRSPWLPNSLVSYLSRTTHQFPRTTYNVSFRPGSCHHGSSSVSEPSSACTRSSCFSRALASRLLLGSLRQHSNHFRTSLSWVTGDWRSTLPSPQCIRLHMLRAVEHGWKLGQHG